ncbi:MAG: hypothetical protein H6R18_2256 [Proteobacteria bacterium]|nr:hypothetical protein [Pseudomonadota bacterium]
MKVLTHAASPAALLFLLAATTAQAASFDCSKAGNKVERLICNDKTLSNLDGDLGKRYQETLELAAAPKEIVQTQRNWLAERNRCPDAACLTQAYRERITVLGKTTLAGWKTYRDPRLKISFEYLENRQVKPCPATFGKDCIALIGHNMAGSDYLIAFHVKTGGLEKVAQEEAGFEQQGSKWMTTFGRGMPVEVEQFSGTGWKGMKATITCGISDKKTGFHAAGGECLWAVMSNGKRSVVADTQGIVGNDANTLRSINSLQFEP